MTERKKKTPDSERLHVLTMDAGGPDSLVALHHLTEITKNIPDFWTELDIIAGTSAAGINSLILGSYLPNQINEGLEAAKRFWHLVACGALNWETPWEAWGSMMGWSPSSQTRGMHWYLDSQIFKGRTLGELNPKLRIMAASFCLQDEASAHNIDVDTENPRDAVPRWMPKIFDSTDPEDAPMKAVDVALATSSYPTFAPMYTFPTAPARYRGFVDGGVYAMSPSLEVLRTLAAESNVPLKEMDGQSRMLSMGNGAWTEVIPTFTQYTDWGTWPWAMQCKFFYLLFASGTTAISQQAQGILQEEYRRINPLIDNRKNPMLVRPGINLAAFKATNGVSAVSFGVLKQYLEASDNLREDRYYRSLGEWWHG